ncbi:hypothetical protein FH972_023981 [Carpinus fangiana]|uniref:Ribosomal RNA-processing protein 40 n=1 Tax=Carpinus fangiana TaxID=176857 RepID=A0A5N6KXE5_9ROSI|nr:hypothetical protein FH972_023981 [Carpinus fangiana]
MSSLLLPGDVVAPDLLPQSQRSKTLTIGPGLRFAPPSTVTATASGSLATDNRKNALWLENNGQGKYIPATGDLVIATVHHSTVDYFMCSLTPYTSHAALPQLSFEGASKKTRPNLVSGSLVYARVSIASKHMDPEIECVHPSTGKADGLGELKDGMLFDVSLGMARRLMMTKSREDGGVAVLEEFGEKGLRFEIAVGRNGKVWINSDAVQTTLAIGKAIRETDERDLNVEDQVKLVRKLAREAA